MDIADFINKNVTSPPVLLGHSFGGLIIQYYLATLGSDQLKGISWLLSFDPYSIKNKYRMRPQHHNSYFLQYSYNTDSYFFMTKSNSFHIYPILKLRFWEINAYAVDAIYGSIYYRYLICILNISVSCVSLDIFSGCIIKVDSTFS